MTLPMSNEIYFGIPLAGLRQVGNKVFGAAAVGPTQEYLVQDWDAQLGDTVYNLYSNRTFYDAIFINEDSILLIDGTYHHVREMKGIGYAPNGIYDSTTWTFFWQERGLCGEHITPYFAIAGGLTYNLPDFNYGAQNVIYYLPQAHTADWRYNKNQYMTGCNFDGFLNSLEENLIQTVEIYPNPTNSLLYFEIENNAIKSIRVTDCKGQIVLFSSYKSGPIDVSKLETGIYYLQLNYTSGEITQAKFSKMN